MLKKILLSSFLVLIPTLASAQVIIQPNTIAIPVGVTQGGTGLTTLEAACIPYASATNTLDCDSTNNLGYDGSYLWATLGAGYDMFFGNNGLYAAVYDASANMFIAYQRGRGTRASKVIVQNNDEIGGFYFDGYDGTGIVGSAFFGVYVDGTPGTSDMPGRMEFKTSPDGTASPTTRLKIDNAGLITFTATLGAQTRTAYDGSNYFSTTVSSAGAATFDATGASASFAFSDALYTNLGYEARGAFTWNGAGTISPTQIVANTDNWAPTGLATAHTIRISSDAARNLTGITAQADGRILILQNVGAFTITLTHDATSTAANRFYLPGAVNYSLSTRGTVIIRYDGTGSRWYIIG